MAILSFLEHLKIKLPPLLVWLNGLSAGLWTQVSRVWFPVRAHGWVVGRVPSWGHARGNLCISHTFMFLSLSFSLPSPLSKNKINKIFKKIKIKLLYDLPILLMGNISEGSEINKLVPWRDAFALTSSLQHYSLQHKTRKQPKCSSTDEEIKKMRCTYDPVVLLLGIYLKNPKTLIWKNICIPMLIAALFTVAKIWKQPKCPSIDKWIKKLCYIYIMEYYSAIKKNKILPFTTAWTDLEGNILSEISLSEKDKYHMISLVCGI